MIINFSTILTTIKTYSKFGINWFKTNGKYKVMSIASLFGLLTFNSWSAFFLACVLGGGYYFAKSRIPQSYMSFINIDFDKYVVNIVVGLLLASIFLFVA